MWTSQLHKIITKLPGGDKAQLKESIQNLQSLYMNQNVTVYPGHGDAFSFEEFEQSDLIWQK